MKGSRPLEEQEVQDVASSFAGRFALRDRALFLLGVKSGFRISELLSLRIGDVVKNGRLVERVTVNRRHMKRKIEGRTVILNAEARDALALWIAELQEEGASRETPVFRSRKGSDQPINRKHAWRILTEAYAVNELAGTLGTHSMRKTFANRVHVLLGRDLVKTQRALGHKNINSTVSYLSFLEEEIDAAILAL
jgi:integrase